MKEYHNVLYAVNKTFLIKFALNILMRYMFLYESNCIHHTKNVQNTNVGQKPLSYFGPSLWNNLNKTLKVVCINGGSGPKTSKWKTQIS